MPGTREAGDYLALAHENLGEAELLLEGGFRRGAASSCYDAMFQAARAFLLVHEKVPRTHRGLVHQLRETLIEQGLADEWFVKSIERERHVREQVDYDAGPPPSQEEVESLLDDAKRFVGEMERLLKALPS